MFLIYNKVIVARSSKSVYFFREEEDEETGDKLWVQYHTIDKPAFISFTEGNVRLQLIENEMIYFYVIDKETWMPKLDSVMSNYLVCNQMIIDRNVRYCISFKANQKDFMITRSKYNHEFMVQLNNQNLEKQIGLCLDNKDAFLVSHTDKVIIYNSNTYQETSRLPIKLLDSDTREPTQVLELQKSDDD
jgi:hypothetical protein